MEAEARNKIASEIIRLRISQMIVNEDYKAKKLKVSVHLALGHETVAVAVSEAMEDGDFLLPTHRNIAYNLARAGRLKPILDEYLLKPTGLSQGKFGSMNLLNPARGIIYTSSILGNQFAVSTGLAMSLKTSKKKNIAIVMGGDGSMEEGVFYESLLMARSLDLPVVFIIENNEWSMSTKIEERRSPIDVSLFAKSLDIDYFSLDGNDPFLYINKLKEARLSSINRSRPFCIEVKVATLGDWVLKTPEHPEGEFINYHAGPAPEVSLNDWPIIRQNNSDPVFALLDYFEKNELEKEAKKQFINIQKEVS